MSEQRTFVNLDGQTVRVAETPEQARLDEALYGVVAVEVKKPSAKRAPPRYEPTPYEERRWDAAEAALRGENLLAARLFREAAALAEPEWRDDCLSKALMFERRAVAGR
jgi:hypothetical protein